MWIKWTIAFSTMLKTVQYPKHLHQMLSKMPKNDYVLIFSSKTVDKLNVYGHRRFKLEI